MREIAGTGRRLFSLRQRGQREAALTEDAQHERSFSHTVGGVVFRAIGDEIDVGERGHTIEEQLDHAGARGMIEGLG